MTPVEGKRNVYRDLIGIPEANRPLRRSRNKRKYNIKKDIKQVGLGGGVCTEFIWLKFSS
jgi:hypothetical protein